MEENYFEAHITFAPVTDNDLERLSAIAELYDFRVSDLLKRNEHTHDLDTFASARDTDSTKLTDRMYDFMGFAIVAGFQVWRYKMEFTVFDSRFEDRWKFIAK